MSVLGLFNSKIYFTFLIEDKKKLVTIIPNIGYYNIDIENVSQNRYRIELSILLLIH